MKTLITILLTGVLLNLNAQDYQPPQDVKLDKVEDYATYRDQVIAGIAWLQKTPISEEAGKRKETNAFLLRWMMGSPDVKLELNDQIVTFADCADCLLPFLGGWTKYTLESGDTDKVQGNLAGLKSLIKFYQDNMASLGKNKAVEKYLKMQEKGKLEGFVKSKI